MWSDIHDIHDEAIREQLREPFFFSFLFFLFCGLFAFHRYPAQSLSGPRPSAGRRRVKSRAFSHAHPYALNDLKDGLREPMADEISFPGCPSQILRQEFWSRRMSSSLSSVKQKGFFRGVLFLKHPIAVSGGVTPLWMSRFQEGSGGLQERPVFMWSTCKHGEFKCVLQQVSRIE